MAELISVIIPVYNRPEQVMKAIASVERQTYQNWEIILVDDGSETLEYQDKLQNKKIRIFNNGINKGVSHARNVGIRNAKGTLLTFLDSDNTWEASFLETMYACLQAGNTKAVFCRWRYVFPDGEKPCLDMRSEKLLAAHWTPVCPERAQFSMNGMAFLRLAVYEKTNFTHINAMLVRREAADFFDESLRISEDTCWIYMLLARVADVGYVDKTLLSFISSNDSVYLFMDRGGITDLSKISRQRQQKLVETLSGSVSAYEKLIAFFQKEGRDRGLANCFRQVRSNKRYTILLLRQMMGVPLRRSDLAGQSVCAYLRFLLGKPPVDLKHICYQRVDYY